MDCNFTWEEASGTVPQINSFVFNHIDVCYELMHWKKCPEIVKQEWEFEWLWKILRRYFCEWDWNDVWYNALFGHKWILIMYSSEYISYDLVCWAVTRVSQNMGSAALRSIQRTKDEATNLKHTRQSVKTGTRTPTLLIRNTRSWVRSDMHYSYAYKHRSQHVQSLPLVSRKINVFYCKSILPVHYPINPITNCLSSSACLPMTFLSWY